LAVRIIYVVAIGWPLGLCHFARELLAATPLRWLPLLIMPVVVVLGVRLAIELTFCTYFVVDKGLGPNHALRASSQTTNGAKWRLLGFFVLGILMNLLGVLCLVVGIFVTLPTVMVATALVYRRLAAQTPELAEFGIIVRGPESDTAPTLNVQE
jgi:uncharacterized membrane protein